MKFFEWFRPGISLKRWISLGTIGVFFISFGLSIIMKDISKLELDSKGAFLLIVSGGTLFFLAIKRIVKTLYQAILNCGYKTSLSSDKICTLLYERRFLLKGPKVVVIGGGTGLSTMLRGLKGYSSNITAIVTVADDGGGSGILRNDLGMLPPGDIRNCILALADTEPILEKLLQYRFSEGMLKGQNFGNLFLAAMDGISNNFEEAVKKMSDVLAVRGKVLPVTLEDVTLCAILEDGTKVIGESSIGNKNDINRAKINTVFLEPANTEPLQEVIDAIIDADVIVLGPGSLYTSIIPNLLVKNVGEAIKKSSAVRVYVCNVMTQHGETEGYSAVDHVKAIEKHSFQGIVNYCILNTTDIPDNLRAKYLEESSNIVKNDSNVLLKEGVKIIEGDFLSIKNKFIRHNSEKLAETIMNIVAEDFFSVRRRIYFSNLKYRIKSLFKK